MQRKPYASVQRKSYASVQRKSYASVQRKPYASVRRSTDTSMSYRQDVYRWLLIGLLLVAFGARVYRIDNQSFWNDEGNSASLSSRSVRLIIEGTASDVHPPLYYLVLRAWWPLAGQSDFSLRMISAVAGTIQVAAAIAIGRMWLSRYGAIAAGLLVALSPPLVYYSQEARMYALLGAIATLSMLVVFKGIQKDKGERLKGNVRFPLIADQWSLITGYWLLTTFGLYTHYVYPAVIVAQGLIVLAWVGQKHAFSLKETWDDTWHWLAAVGAALLAYAPWIPIFLRTGASTREAGSASAAEFLQETALWLIVGPFAELSSGWLIGMIFGGLGIILGIVALINRNFSMPAALAFIWLFTPFLLMFAVGATDENYRKFLTVAVPAVWLLVLVGTEWQEQIRPRLKERRIPTTLFVAAFVVFPFLFGLHGLYTNPLTFRDDYRGIVAQIKQDGRENAAVILNAPNQWEVFTWYGGDGGGQTLYPMPKSRRPDEQIAQEVEAVLAEHDFVYALFWGFEGFDPNRVVERTLDQKSFKSTDEWFGDVRLVTYGVLGDFLPSDNNPPDLTVDQYFLLPNGKTGSGVQLNWVEVSGSEFQPGDVIGLAFEWEAVREIDGRYKVFIHLIDENGQLVAQRDSEPVGNLKPTDGWQVGEVVLDQHGVLIPAGAPAGEYELVMGLYEVLPPNGRLILRKSGSDVVRVPGVVVR